jgi:hypothetical protein
MTAETAQIIQLSGFRPKLGKRILPIAKNSSNPQYEEGISDTAGNQRLRSNRRDVWREADAVMDYWHVSMKMDGAIARVQNFGTPEGELYLTRDPKGYWTLVVKYR